MGDYGEGDPVWANWHGGSAWLSQHLWEHYAFGGDVQFLRERAYPVMKARVRVLPRLARRRTSKGHLVTSPSTSPEHKFSAPDGGTAALSAGATMDLALMWDLFTNTIEASTVLGIDAAFRERIRAARARLHPLSDRQARPAAGVGEGVRGAGAAAPALLASLRRASRPPDHAARRRRRSSPRRADRWSCAATTATGWSMAWKIELLGAHARRRSRARAPHATCSSSWSTATELHARRRRVPEPLRRASAVPDRRQLRRDGGHRRDAAAEPRR